MRSGRGGQRPFSLGGSSFGGAPRADAPQPRPGSLSAVCLVISCQAPGSRWSERRSVQTAASAVAARSGSS
jgi:hypothetical protein